TKQISLPPGETSVPSGTSQWDSWAAPPASFPTSFEPRCLQAEPERVNTHAAPKPPSSKGAPTSAVLPSADKATLSPNEPLPLSPAPVSLVSSIHLDPRRMNTQAAPTSSPSLGPPTKAMLPFDERATLLPVKALPISSVGISSACCT